MTRRVLLRLRASTALAVCLLAATAKTAEPVVVTVEGIVPVDTRATYSLRDRALAEAIVAAVVDASRRFLPPATFAVDEEREALRARLRDVAPSFVLTYRVDGSLARRPQLENPDLEEVVLVLTASVDAGQLREFLRASGLLRDAGNRPSIALRVSPAAGLSPSESAGLLAGFEQFLLRHLEAGGFVLVEPALRPSGLESPEDALALARSLGADLALDVRVGWRPRLAESRVVGGVAEVRVRALRAHDGVEIARSRFEAPGYHDDRQEAVVRALQALGDQVAQNLQLQLERNWQTLARERGPVELQLRNVTSLLQTTAVRDVLSNALDARRVALVALGPGSAEMQVEISLSPGALQDRLATFAFDGFLLEPIATTRDRVELRVEPQPELALEAVEIPVGGP